MSTTKNFAYPHLVTQIQNLHLDENTKDITFTFDDSDQIIRAHKFLLTTASSVFGNMFSGKFKEEDTAVIYQIRPEIFEMLIYGIYMKPIKITSMEDAIELYNAAEMYNMVDAKDQAQKYMHNNVYWDNAIYLYERITLFDLGCIRKDCQKVFKQYHYQCLISHLFRGEEIMEDTFIQIANQWKGEDGELYQILEVYVELGLLKTYAKVIGTISFIAQSIEGVLSAKLLTDEEKCSVIANQQSHEARFETFMKMPPNLTDRGYVHHKDAEAGDYAHLMWIALLFACTSRKEYFKFLLKKCVHVGGGFMNEGVYEKAFESIIKGERMKKADCQLLFEESKKYINFFVKYELCYDEETGIRMVELKKFRDVNAELFRFDY